jgi:hypothetical protein
MRGVERWARPSAFSAEQATRSCSPSPIAAEQRAGRSGRALGAERLGALSEITHGGPPAWSLQGPCADPD